MEFYMVVAWNHYYPSAGISNIKYVAPTYEKAVELAKQNEDNYDRVEVFSSYELPWEE